MNPMQIKIAAKSQKSFGGKVQKVGNESLNTFLKTQKKGLKKKHHVQFCRHFYLHSIHKVIQIGHKKISQNVVQMRDGNRLEYILLNVAKKISLSTTTFLYYESNNYNFYCRQIQHSIQRRRTLSKIPKGHFREVECSYLPEN